jgi:VWFA-related protein
MMDLCNPRGHLSFSLRMNRSPPMTFTKLAGALFVSLLSAALSVAAQQSVPAVAPQAPSPSSQQLHLDVVVDTKNGEPVINLAQQDFTILDNKTPRPITSFKVVTAAQEPVEVILLIDAVNTPFSLVSYMRDQSVNFLKAHEGRLAHPTAIAIFTDKGIQLSSGFSTNGISLADALEHQLIGLREITRDSQWGDNERLQISLGALHQLADFGSKLPGRKIVLWISPGWPLFSGPHMDLSIRQEQQIFSEVVDLSTRFRQIGLTLYNINPIGVSESLPQAFYYKSFLKGVSRPDQAQFGNLGLQVFATQSGGLVFEGNSDVAGLIQKSLADAQSWYQIDFDPLPADKPNEYHHIEIKVDQPGLVARSRDGYYANPLAAVPGR